MSATWARLLDTTVPGRPLALTRVLFALASLVMLRSSSRRFADGLDPDLPHVVWPVVGDALHGVPVAVPTVLWGGGALLALTGWMPRVATASVAGGMLIFHGADQQHYGNGAYLLMLVATLLTVADTGASRTPWGPDRRQAPWWPAFLLAAQLSIVYGYAAVQKLRRSSLRGDTVDFQLNGPLAEQISWSGLPAALNALGGAAEAFCAVALWFAPTRRVAVIVGVILHVGVLGFIRPTPDLVGFGLVSLALYPAYWVASPPLGRAVRELRARRPGADDPARLTTPG